MTGVLPSRKFQFDMRKLQFAAVGFLAVAPLLAAYVGSSIGGGILHPMRLNRMRLEETLLAPALRKRISRWRRPTASNCAVGKFARRRRMATGCSSTTAFQTIAPATSAMP